MKKLILLLAILIGATAHAGDIYIEPEAGWVYGETRAQGTLRTPFGVFNLNATDFANGPTVGAYLGYREDYVHVLGTARVLMTSGDKGANASTAYVYGAGLGIDWNPPIMTTFMIMKGEGSGDSETADPWGLRLGLSWYFMNNGKLNLTYDRFSGNIEQLIDVRTVIWGLSVSLPIPIDYPEQSWRKTSVE